MKVVEERNPTPDERFGWVEQQRNPTYRLITFKVNPITKTYAPK